MLLNDKLMCILWFIDMLLNFLFDSSIFRR